MRVRCGVSFVSSESHSYSASVIAVLYTISWYIGPHCNGTCMHVCIWLMHNQPVDVILLKHLKLKYIKPLYIMITPTTNTGTLICLWKKWFATMYFLKAVAMFLYPHSTKGGMGVYWIHPDVCTSVRSSIWRQVSGTFWKNYWCNSFHTWHCPYGMSLLTPIHFCVPSLILGPLVAKYLAENGVSGTFCKKLLAQFISYLAFTLMG